MSLENKLKIQQHSKIKKKDLIFYYQLSWYFDDSSKLLVFPEAEEIGLFETKGPQSEKME